MPDMLPEASVALHRVNMNDSLVLPETVPLFLNHLTTFASTQPERAAALQTAALDDLAASYGYEPSREREKPFIYQDGVAVIPVHGILLNRFNGCWGFATGYNFIRAQLNAVLDDLEADGGDVRLLAFDHNSPGGEAVGCFELAAEIMAARDRVQMISVVDSLSASADYALASATQRMVCTPSGSVGSVGVYRLHVDVSEALLKAGIKYTIISAGEHKVDGNPYTPLPKDVAEDMQKGVDKRWDEFIEVVAEQRGISPDAVRATQARVYRADEALDLQLIDAVNTPSEAVSEFLAELAGDDPETNGDEDMALPKNETELAAMIASAKAEGVASVPTPDLAAASNAAVAADRQRRKDIMALPEAANRQKLATTLSNMDTDVATAKAILTDAAEETKATGVEVPGETVSTDPKAKPGESQSAFLARMDAEGGPNLTGNSLGGSGAGPSGEMSDDDKAKMILGDQTKFTGIKLRSVG